MGAVYLAHELALDRDVAIKVLPPDRALGTDALERFRREARTAARLQHPHIVPLHTFGEVNGLVYLVMGFVRGEPLSARLRRSGRMEVDEVRRVLGEVASALGYAHEHGVVHRDIKPDNILIDSESGRAMLTDFGVAKAQGAGATLTAMGTVVGTPHYMSPEQAAGRQDVDGRSDLYSLGVMAYAMLAGRPPFDGPTAGEILTQHLTRAPEPLDTVAEGVPADMAAAIMRCLAKNPADRWPDARAFGHAVAGIEEAELPAKLTSLNAGMQGLVALLLANGYLALYRAANPLAGSEPFVAMLTALLVAVMAINAVEARRKLKVSWRLIARVMLRQPVWWPGCYPPTLRRPGDLWPRLPTVVRRARNVTAVALLFYALVAIPLLIGQLAASEYYERTGLRTAAGDLLAGPSARRERFAVRDLGSVVVILALGASIGSAVVWLKKRVGSAFDSDEMPVLGATWKRQSPWRRPEYQSLLAPPDDRATRSAPATRDDLQKAAVGLASALDVEHGDLGARCRDAARSLGESLRALDAAEAEAASDADPDEVRRVEEKLEKLGAAEAAGERGAMRDLLVRQLDLLRGTATRLARVRQERAAQSELLHALWRQLSAAARGSTDAVQRQSTAAALRAVCAEIERRTAGGAKAGAGDDAVADLPTREYDPRDSR